MHLVCVSPHVPHIGVDHAGGDYLQGYLSALHRLGWQVTLIAPLNVQTRHDAARAEDWMRVVLAPRDRLATCVRAPRLILGGANGMPPRRWWRKLGPAARVALQSADVIDLQWMNAVQYAPLLRRGLPGVPILATPHDVKSESVSRATSSLSLAYRLGARAALRAVTRVEREALNACTRIFVFKEQDRRTLRRLGVSVEVSTTPPLVKVSERAPVPDAAGSTMLFSAAFWRSENDEASRWFLEEVWPIVSAARPTSRVRFAGARPSAWLQTQASERVEVTGFQHHLLDGYRDVSLVIAPLRRGAGLKFKVVQALALGFPVVATEVAAEGINELLPHVRLRGYDDPRAFAAEILAVLGDLPARISIAQDEAKMTAAILDFEARIAEQVGTYDTLTAG